MAKGKLWCDLEGIVRSLMANRTDILSLSGTRKSNSPTEISRRAFGGSVGAMAFGIATAGHTQPTQPGKKLGVALVGLGGYSTGELAPALREAKSCYLAGVVTGSPEKGRRWAHDFRFPERNIFSYDTMAQLKNAPDIDIVYVVTPNALHARHAIAVARAGKHVISEKPFTTSVADAEAVIAACREAKVKLSIGYRLHFDPYYRELIKLVDSQEFGKFLSARGEHSRDVSGTEGWRLNNVMGGGPLKDLGILCHSGRMHGRRRTGSGFGYGQTGREDAADHHRYRRIDDMDHDICEWFGLRMFNQLCEPAAAKRFSCGGAEGLDQDQQRLCLPRARGRYQQRPARLVSHPPVRQQTLQMDDFARCILEDRPSRVPGEMGLRDTKIIAAIYEAASSGQRVQVNA